MYDSRNEDAAREREIKRFYESQRVAKGCTCRNCETCKEAKGCKIKEHIN